MKDIQYLSLDDALQIARRASSEFSAAFQLLGSTGEQALGGALGNGVLHYYGETLIEQAVAMYCNLIKDHAFNNGNKRFALLALDVCLARNGVLVDVEVEDPAERDNAIAQLADKVAADELDRRDVVRLLTQTACAPMSLQEATEFSLLRRSEALRTLSKR